MKFIRKTTLPINSLKFIRKKRRLQIKLFTTGGDAALSKLKEKIKEIIKEKNEYKHKYK